MSYLNFDAGVADTLRHRLGIDPGNEPERHVCRRPRTVILGTPILLTCRSNQQEKVSGSIELSSSRGKTRPESRHDGPQAVRSSAWGRCQALRTATATAIYAASSLRSAGTRRRVRAVQLCPKFMKHLRTPKLTPVANRSPVASGRDHVGLPGRAARCRERS